MSHVVWLSRIVHPLLSPSLPCFLPVRMVPYIVAISLSCFFFCKGLVMFHITFMFTHLAGTGLRPHCVALFAHSYQVVCCNTTRDCCSSRYLFCIFLCTFCSRPSVSFIWQERWIRPSVFLSLFVDSLDIVSKECVCVVCGVGCVHVVWGV